MNKRVMSRIAFLVALLAVIIGGLALNGIFLFGVAQTPTNFSGIIHSDTTWTKANSPYTLTGPVAVNQGVTLTIQAGATVNLGSYYIQVNGTLTARGSDNDKIHFNGGKITFTSVSNGWNDQISTGCIIDNAVINQTTIASTNSLKISNNDITGAVSVGNSSIIQNNIITCTGTIISDSGALPNSILVGDSSTISDNNIAGRLVAQNHAVIAHNILTPGEAQANSGDAMTCEVTAWESCVISDNTISGITIPDFPVTSKATAAISAGESSTISNNIVSGIITGYPSAIRNNTVIAGGEYHDFSGRDTGSRYAISITSSSCVFSDNTITATTGAAVSAGTASFFSNNIKGSILSSDLSTFSYNIITGAVSGGSTFFNNTIVGSINIGADSPVISGNVIKTGGIRCNGRSVSISDNTISDGAGIIEAAGTIERNLITNNTDGISLGSLSATIRNNTITKNAIGISMGSSASAINYNNIQDNSQNSIYLSASTDVDATNNWWGTANSSAINQTIHDFKNDFNLGTVNFVPFLTESNPEATPSSNPTPPNSTTPTTSPTPNPTSTPTPNQSHSPSPSSPTSSPSPTQNSTMSPNPSNNQAKPETGLNMVEIAILTVLIIIAALLTAILALILKKRQ